MPFWVLAFFMDNLLCAPCSGQLIPDCKIRVRSRGRVEIDAGS